MIKGGRGKMEGVADKGKEGDKGLEWITDEKISEGREKELDEGHNKVTSGSRERHGACLYIYSRMKGVRAVRLSPDK